MENMEVMEVQQPKQRKARRLMSLMLALAVMMSLALPCFAAETGGGAATVLESADTITTLITKVFELITGNWYLTLFLCLSLLGVGIAGFRKMKSATR